MCGIIGILSEKDASPNLVEGLRRLEYRGYDSAGIATLHDGKLERRRAEGKLKNLEAKLKDAPLKGTLGIGHTRWATHGGPTEDNAHPHATEKVAVVHNGIIENYAALKNELAAHQVRFETDTDTEVIVHLVDHYLAQGKSPQDAANATFDRLEGAFAVVMIFAGQDNLMIGCRQGTPLAVGYGDGEMFVASDSYALAPLTKKICFLEDGDRVTVTREGAQIYMNDNTPVTREIRITAQSGATTGKGNFRHFMLKEIYEQPSVIGDTLNSFVNPATGEISIPPDVLAALEAASRITMVACGTAYYACIVAKYWFEQTVGIPCDVDIASEFRYREPPLASDTLCIVVSQSGETLDTLEGMRYAKSKGCKVLSIVNTIESTIERESDFVMHTLAGPEIGVASTKAFTTQLTTLACITLSLAVKKYALDAGQAARLADELRHIPMQITQLLRAEESAETIQSIARDIFESADMLYLGRNLLYPLAMEGALKLKEVSYIHAEGYAAGELKHGPIALIDDRMPIVVLAPANDTLFEKTASNLQENVARGAKVLLISDDQGYDQLKSFTTWNINVQPVDPFVAPILYAVPIQLLAYHVAVTKGTDVDQPRNLAKSVTVE
ncbi:MAG: glutamine--fructose-6-phosphate transaminase (isomerizing) [Rhodospirillales bacterium]|nr:glutamine--fructose-6-phosphate transaminase (isomerizing) [Alphaproteobacteria bacterium]MCB9981496.1 glutamine--fructose-6-phosphate transaminase (isomerizing) [Rhodospirillales bacterium]